LADKDLFIDLSLVDFDNPTAGIDDIRQINPQRFEMEQLTAIVHDDIEAGIFVAYKDITTEEFWVRGHMPGMPLMPGVVMLEACAQACSYFGQRHDLLGSEMLGFGGLDNVRFRDPVIAGERFVIICRLVKARRNRMIICDFQGVVNGNLACAGTLRGIPIPVDLLRAELDSRSAS
jgi:3-hydroxyacyl-[acyl-carrier-protein] dehydratase